MKITKHWLLVCSVAFPAVSVLAQTARVPEQGSTATASGAETLRNQQGIRGLEEIIVTAQRREERLQDVPISIAALDGKHLDSITDRGVGEALNRVPGVVNLPLGAGERFGGNSAVGVRGIPGGGAGVGGSATAYYLDSVPFGFIRQGFAPDSSAYDLQRVEVLRGPQGTLYGSSALNGVVRVLTNDASLDKLELKGRASGSGMEDGGTSYRGDLAVNVPIVDGKFAARAVVGYQDLAGWIDKPREKDANDKQTGTGRVKINAQPTDQFSVGLLAWFSRADGGAPSHSPDGRHSFSQVDDEWSLTDYDAFGAKLRYEFSAFAIDSMTSYIDYINESFIDISAIAPGTIHSIYDSKVFAQEINLSSTHEGPWRWNVGGIYRDAEDKVWQLRSVNYLAPADSRTYSESFALFGEVTRSFFGDKFELTGGVRYFEDAIYDAEFSNLNYVGGIPPGGLLVTPKSKFDDVSPRVVVAWLPSEGMSFYASYAEGFRSGMNQLFTVARLAPEFPPVNPDSLTNYEVGAKGSLWGGRVTFETAVFFIDWTDVQQSFAVVVRPPGVTNGVLVNAGNLSGAGADFGITASPLSGLTLSANVSWNDLTADADVRNASGALVIARDDRLVGSPETTASASIDYAFALGDGGWNGHFSTSANYLSSMVVGRNFTGKSVRDSTVLSRASFAVESPDAWTAALFVDNVGNEKGFSPDINSLQWSQWLRPRTYGVQIEYGF